MSIRTLDRLANAPWPEDEVSKAPIRRGHMIYASDGRPPWHSIGAVCRDLRAGKGRVYNCIRHRRPLGKILLSYEPFKGVVYRTAPQGPESHTYD